MKEYLHGMYERMINAMGVDGLEIATTGVKIFTKDKALPEWVDEAITSHLTITACQAVRQAALGDVITLTTQNIGCIAAAISFGLVDEDDFAPMSGSRVYTDLMSGRHDNDDNSSAPSPKDFTQGRVYACHEPGNEDFCLFGEDDAGRFQSSDVARRAINEMSALQPANNKAICFYPHADEYNLLPDVVVLSVRPVELTKLIQGYQYITGERIIANIGPLRAVNSDLIVRPYLEQKINITPYCLGARLIGQFEADKLGMGIPWNLFKILVEGLEASKTGYPFPLYPGASESLI
ncbi:DUF169 domain-containing protein [bacterium]|nr:DUF169 domain-containing protein [bacterium]